MFPIIPCSLVLVLVLVLVLWLDGKISYISRNNGSGKSELSFTYDAMGNRVEKTVNNDAGTWTETEYYVRDAQGNVMAIYKKNVTSGQMNYILTEQHMYGSSRLGVDRRNVDVIAASSPSDNVSRVVKRGEKHYELSNHLGNVLATVSDKKIAVMSGANLSYYRADVVSYSDYYPFGAPMTERTAVVTPTDVRYGFNSQEKEEEITGFVTHTSAEYWMYDNRLGRRWNTDPKSHEGRSTYLVFSGSPIQFNDVLGDTVKVTVTTNRVGFTKINLYSSPEIEQDVSRKSKQIYVPVYEVKVETESGACATFYYTRINYRAVKKNNYSIEDVTFDAAYDGQLYGAKIKSRWNKKNNVLEIRELGEEDGNCQDIVCTRNRKVTLRTAIQFHLKGASDGCLLACGTDNIEEENGENPDYSDTGSSTGAAQMKFMNIVQMFRKLERNRGNSDVIIIKVQKMSDSQFEKDTKDTEAYNKSKGG